MLLAALQEVLLIHRRTRGFSLSCALLAFLPFAACGNDETLNTGLPSRVFDAGGDTDDETEPSGRPTPPAPPPSEPPASSGPSPFGTACSRDGQCADGLTCITNDDDRFLGGGVANGYCSLECQDDGDCSARDPNAFCLGVSETSGFCVQGCQPGADSPNKCQGRGDMACDGVTLDVPFCRPMCRSDDDCGAGRSCDVGFGICVENPLEGEPIGAQCDPDLDGPENGCASGLCLPFSDTFAVCTGWCNVSEYGCGPDSPTVETPGDPMCVWGANPGGISAGDLGFCNQRCDCDGDCLHPDAKCLLVGEQLAGLFGASGLCVSPDWEPQAGEVLGAACPDRDAGVADASVPDAGRALDGGDPDASADLDAAVTRDAARDQ